MKKTGFGKRLVVILLASVMVLGLGPVSNLPEVFAAENEPTIVIAGSDFQNPDGHEAGADQVITLLNQIKADGYTTADGFLFAGDYDYQMPEEGTVDGKNALQAAVQSVYGTALDEVYIQGNHDADGMVTDGILTPSGDNDTENYGVYVINEMDYMWGGSEKATVQKTAAALSDYLNAKLAQNYTKPIFVVSHLPLHYTMRTYHDGDGKYANFIFDELNIAGAAGLNIIFLYGHNHSSRWDDYLGGSAIYLTKGDCINIAQSSKKTYKEMTLSFTYMNAGYVGYYHSRNDGCEKDLTMTVFEITDDKVVIKRYSENGLHDLKSVGVPHSYGKPLEYDANTSVYESPQILDLTAQMDLAALEDMIAMIECVNGENYTADSYAALSQALEGAKTLLEDPGTAQETIDTAVASLQSALKMLEKVETTNPTEPVEDATEGTTGDTIPDATQPAEKTDDSNEAPKGWSPVVIAITIVAVLAVAGGVIIVIKKKHK